MVEFYVFDANNEKNQRMLHKIFDESMTISKNYLTNTGTNLSELEKESLCSIGSRKIIETMIRMFSEDKLKVNDENREFYYKLRSLGHLIIEDMCDKSRLYKELRIEIPKKLSKIIVDHIWKYIQAVICSTSL